MELILNIWLIIIALLLNFWLGSIKLELMRIKNKL